MDRLEPLVEQKIEKKEDTIKKEESKSVQAEKKEVPTKKISLKKESIKQAISIVVESKNEEKIVEPAEKEIELEKELPATNSYVSNFENLTISDVKKEMEEEEKERLAKEKKEIADNFVEEKFSPTLNSEEENEPNENLEKEKPVKKLVIEKPNYDFIPDKKGKIKEKKKSKLKTVAVACALAVATVGCVAGSVLVDNLQSSYIELQDEYNLNLLSYLRNINNLNATNSSMDFLETYPEDLTEPSSIGESSNWFDNLANFIAGIFGG